MASPGFLPHSRTRIRAPNHEISHQSLIDTITATASPHFFADNTSLSLFLSAASSLARPKTYKVTFNIAYNICVLQCLTSLHHINAPPCRSRCRLHSRTIPPAAYLPLESSARGILQPRQSHARRPAVADAEFLPHSGASSGR